ncbi:hypothetical protein PUR57_00635, partial [Streptomyces sp. JV176]|uniref:hypothetical protein n=1 Tax=Streptomyces sp. JV176 TaxID=858630 RepID=UPI002E7A1FC7
QFESRGEGERRLRHVENEEPRLHEITSQTPEKAIAVTELDRREHYHDQAIQPEICQHEEAIPSLKKAPKPSHHTTS